ncbi:TPA: cell division ATP-binding protein FtsE [candidate division CPR2 bacterium]|uniref:Cell division ATP-binding protein FtsE n=1 Tax=candidate division CPR2 bacterium GW2011_GWC1_41_48 TaxID=1618344 RepID=A0A0G0YJN2_UNCC2|nr:MAG: Cell division ATP-binding protein FtsE [candidate division CPR2 bacterium GW2011_GWC2_39_35]KKR29433.1 MAG: Cell division ATP-binding protein FtsE [candidate division CPR2 bacterium GW2011_GWD2_39_7]KKS09736.1 MAG: cell division ATP-binding protein, cell division transport system ATP-binding protein [candidate division CPR2 bacterium GW2011_GWC1_41_48]HBG81533.1 cell division ATP-binding protein FtsE [candidate division CPR2 bacterium]HCL99502.1 cell division ATP-binding protein FtsE [c
MIYFEKVTKEYPNGTTALKDINLHIKPKEFVTVVGTSGAGKSTLIRCIFMEDRPTYGKIFVGGVDLTSIRKSDIPYLRRKIGVVFQDYKLLPQKTVFENVSFALEASGMPAKEIKNRVPKILQLVGLAEKHNNFPNELSGGEQQRVAIARAVVRQPKILIADEPTGNLDPKNAWEIIDLLLKINQYGTTVVMTTHNKDIVNAIKKRVITINQGRVSKDQEVGRYTI